jgi:hypothetical protein
MREIALHSRAGSNIQLRLLSRKNTILRTDQLACRRRFRYLNSGGLAMSIDSIPATALRRRSLTHDPSDSHLSALVGLLRSILTVGTKTAIRATNKTKTDTLARVKALIGRTPNERLESRGVSPKERLRLPPHWQWRRENLWWKPAR